MYRFMGTWYALLTPPKPIRICEEVSFFLLAMHYMDSTFRGTKRGLQRNGCFDEFPTSDSWTCSTVSSTWSLLIFRLTNLGSQVRLSFAAWLCATTWGRDWIFLCQSLWQTALLQGRNQSGRKHLSNLPIRRRKSAGPCDTFMPSQPRRRVRVYECTCLAFIQMLIDIDAKLPNSLNRCKSVRTAELHRDAIVILNAAGHVVCC